MKRLKRILILMMILTTLLICSCSTLTNVSSSSGFKEVYDDVELIQVDSYGFIWKSSTPYLK